KVWEAHAEPAVAAATAAPGTVLSAGAEGVRVACGNGVLCMTLLQRAGGKRLAAGDFLRGFDLPEGAVLEGAADGGTP
ncbi:methionyl-tRNA formyltransferase, partial [Burkholderia sola]